MSYPGKGRADYLVEGDWNAVCYFDGFKYKASELRRHWQGFYVCKTCWETRQPQDFVRSLPDVQTPPWAQPRPTAVYEDTSVLLTNSQDALASGLITITPDFTTTLASNGDYVNSSGGLIYITAEGTGSVPGGTGPYVVKAALTAGTEVTLKLQYINNMLVWGPLPLALLCGIGQTTSVLNSRDGITWTESTATALNDWRSITFASGLPLYCAVSSTGTNRVMTSPDGITWTAQSATEANSWHSVTWSPTLMLFVAVSNDGTNRVMTSRNGTSWIARSAASASTWRRVYWVAGFGLFVAFSQSSDRIMTSPDGVTWTVRTAPSGNDYVGLAYSPTLGRAVATSSNADVGMYSSDGITWSGTSGLNSSSTVAWSPTLAKFVSVRLSGVAAARVQVSTNGISWTDTGVAVTTNTWNTVLWSNQLELFVALSESGGTSHIMTSPDGITWTDRTTANNGYRGLANML